MAEEASAADDLLEKGFLDDAYQKGFLDDAYQATWIGGRSAVRRMIGARIRERRLELEWTQAELARRMGMSREALSQYEIGRAGVDSGDLPLLSHVMGVPIMYFYARVHAVDVQAEVINYYKGLSEHDRQTIRDLMESLYRRRGVVKEPPFTTPPVIHRRKRPMSSEESREEASGSIGTHMAYEDRHSEMQERSNEWL